MTGLIVIIEHGRLPYHPLTVTIYTHPRDEELFNRVLFDLGVAGLGEAAGRCERSGREQGQGGEGHGEARRASGPP